MTEQKDVKKALEEILGHELPQEALELFNLFSNVATYDRTDKPGEYFLTEKSLIVNIPNRCGTVNLLDLSGWWMTGSDGTSRFRLTDFMCEKTVPFIYPINVVVTPIASKPYFATVLHSLVKNTNNEVVDAEIQVSIWDANGAPAPNIAFDWRCRVPIPIIIL
jgi:hypothetical protein